MTGAAVPCRPSHVYMGLRAKHAEQEDLKLEGMWTTDSRKLVVVIAACETGAFRSVSLSCRQLQQTVVVPGPSHGQGTIVIVITGCST